jgi:tRNA modification GTPase
MAADTIFGLSSGPPPAGVAVIRVSGPAVRVVLETLTGSVPAPRLASLRVVTGLHGPVDRGLVLFFPAPGSFTGEDVAEFQVHGGRAVLGAVLGAIAAVPGTRLAEPGEFTRRAFLNRRLDLSQVEGLADLVRAETEVQRRQALRQSEGGLSALAESWRERLLRARALVEAELDFGEEEGFAAAGEASGLVGAVRSEIAIRLVEAEQGIRVREGISVVLLGAPNAGKSSLLNAIARSEVAIVTPEPGTTRDLIEAPLDLGGYAVTVVDTAGLREAASLAESEGIRRARERADRADVVVWLEEVGSAVASLPELGGRVIRVASKADLIDSEEERQRVTKDGALLLSIRTGEGVAALVGRLTAFVAESGATELALVTRVRHVEALTDCSRALGRALECKSAELVAEELRAATQALGRLTGRVDVEQVLDTIFAEFCIGK